MKAIETIAKFFLRFRYPVSFPQEIGTSLGVDFPLLLTFDEFFNQLTGPNCKPTRLKRLMSREEAERKFENARRVEKFQENTLISYYFSEGWIEFDLRFGPDKSLRRIYLHHNRIQKREGIELPLK